MLNTRSQRSPATQARHQLARVADALRHVAERRERTGNGVDRLLPVELRRLLLAVTFAQVVLSQIVGQPDPHRDLHLGVEPSGSQRSRAARDRG